MNLKFSGCKVILMISRYALSSCWTMSQRQSSEVALHPRKGHVDYFDITKQAISASRLVNALDQSRILYSGPQIL